MSTHLCVGPPRQGEKTMRSCRARPGRAGTFASASASVKAGP